MKQPDTTQPCYLGACDVAANVGKNNVTINDLGIVRLSLVIAGFQEAAEIVSRCIERLQETNRVIAHAQAPAEPLTPESIARYNEKYGRKWEMDQ